MTWLGVISNIVSLLYALAQYVNAQRNYNSGWAAAVNAGLKQASVQIEAAAEELANADKIHARDQTDGAFDSDFKRGD